MKVELVEVEPTRDDIAWLLQHDTTLLGLLGVMMVSFIVTLYLLCKPRTMDTRTECKDD